MKKIEEIWDNLISGADGSDRILIRRFSASVKPNIFVGYKVQVGLKCLAISVLNESISNFEYENTIRDIRIEIASNEQDQSRSFLLITLTDNELTPVFAVVCEDLIDSLRDVTDEAELINSLFERVEHWQLLFERFRGQGLSESQQRGLYGEIFLLRKLLQEQSIANKVTIRSWVGPKLVPKDFQYSNWGVEVKTTTGRNHQRLKINNELQLDDTNLEAFFVFHLTLEVHEGDGETLPELISAVRALFQSSISLKRNFDSKLVRAGYFDEQEDFYTEIGYHIRTENLYRVTEDFPRLIERDLPPGVGDLIYTIDAGICANHSSEFTELVNHITDAG